MLWRAIGAGTGFACVLAIILAGSQLSVTILLAAGLILSVLALFKWVPALEAPTQRVVPALIYAGAFGYGWLLSIHQEGRNHQVPIYWALAALFIGSFTIGLLTAVVKRHPLLRNPWLIAALFFGFFSARYSGSAGGSGGSWESWLMQHLGFDKGAAEWAVIGFRKTVHFVFYGLLGVVAYKAASGAGRKALYFGIGFALVHALYDESRQLYATNRTGRYEDVLLDLAGALFFLGVGKLWYRRKRHLARKAAES